MIQTDIMLPTDYGKDELCRALRARIPVTADEAATAVPTKKVLISSDGKFLWKVSVALSLPPEREAGLLKIRKKVTPADDPSFHLPPVPPAALSSVRPAVVGFGPAGMFAALLLSECGLRPVIFERGERVEERDERVRLFNTRGILSPDSNIQFGEGGAGTFSDGKLKCGAMDKYKRRVLSEFVSHGAPEDILYTVGSHLGTDKLRGYVRGIRERIISLGGSFRFSSRVDGIVSRGGRISALEYTDSKGTHREEVTHAVLATGHSARDTYRMLLSLGVIMEPRGFGVGVRAEHPREYIDRIVYRGATPPGLGSASYHLVTHLPGGRSVYSFCMCPGGVVVGATSTASGVVTNGMSASARDGENSNAALLVSLTPDDFGGTSPLAGIELQERLERAAYAAHGGYVAPAECLGDFLSAVPAPSGFGSVFPSYLPGTAPYDLSRVLPPYVTGSLRAAIPDFDAWLPGYTYPDVVLTATETRSTAPVRITRLPDFSLPGFPGLYAAGEGAGYSGGIVSSAVDGLRCAEAIVLSLTK